MKKDLTKNQALVFANHRTAKGFHFTSDGQAFAKEGDANNHKHTLEDKSVEYIENPNPLDVPEGDQPAGETKPAPSKPEKPAKPAKSATPAKKAVVKEQPAKTAEQLELDGARAEYAKLYEKSAPNLFKIEKLKELIAAKTKPADQTAEKTNP